MAKNPKGSSLRNKLASNAMKRVANKFKDQNWREAAKILDRAEDQIKKAIRKT